jgi:anti-sigma factor RsiW
MSEHPEGLDLACRHVVELITDYLEGALDPATAAAVEQHLRDCPGCQEYLAQMRTTIAATGHVPAESLSERVKAELLATFRGRRLGR